MKPGSKVKKPFEVRLCTSITSGPMVPEWTGSSSAAALPSTVRVAFLAVITALLLEP
jgi:hypothetical protein